MRAAEDHPVATQSSQTENALISLPQAPQKSLKSPAWEFFYRMPQKFDTTYFFASCKNCVKGKNERAALGENLLSSINANCPSPERTKQRKRAAEKGFVKGRGREMLRHVALHCIHSTASQKGVARALLDADYSNSRLQDALPSAGAYVGTEVVHRPGSSSGQLQSKGGSMVGTKRKANVSVADYLPGGPKWKVNKRLFQDAVAELMAVDKIPFNVFECSRFRKLVAVLTGLSAEDQDRAGLLVYQRLVRQVILPNRYEAAAKKLRERSNTAFAIGLTFADDGFVNRKKEHVSGVTVSSPSPSVHSMTIAIIDVLPEDLHAVAIARGWEEIVLLAQSQAPLGSYPKGYFTPVVRVPVAFCSDDASANHKARDIAALRIPWVVFLQCFAHQVALICGDMLTKGKHAKAIAKALVLVHFFNKRTHKWLIWLNNEMVITYGKQWSLVRGVVTRWTTTWLSAISVLRAKVAMQKLMLSGNADQEFRKSQNLNSPHAKKQRLVRDIISDNSFWESLQTFLGEMLPTIEATLQLQSGNATLADVFFALARIYQSARNAETQGGRESPFITAFEERFKGYELPLLILATWLHPKYKYMIDRMITNDVIDLAVLEGWVSGYFNRWLPSSRESDLGSPASFITAVASWQHHTSDAMLRLSVSFEADPGRFWRMVAEKHSVKKSEGGESSCLYALAIVAERIFCILPNAANAERLFSEIGRAITPSRTRLVAAQSHKLQVIAEDCRCNERDLEKESGKSLTRHRKNRIADSSAAIAVLRKVREAASDDCSEQTQCAPQVMSSFIERAVAHEARASNALQNFASERHGTTQSRSRTTEVRSSEGSILDLVEHGGDGSQDSAEIGDIHDGEYGNHGAETAVAEEDGSPPLGCTSEDVEVTEMAAFDFTRFQEELSKQIESQSGALESESFGTNSAEEEARKTSLDLYPLGKLPKSNEDLPRDRMDGFRGWKLTAAELFGTTVVGVLPVMTTMSDAGHS